MVDDGVITMPTGLDSAGINDVTILSSAMRDTLIFYGVYAIDNPLSNFDPADTLKPALFAPGSYVKMLPLNLSYRFYLTDEIKRKNLINALYDFPEVYFAVEDGETVPCQWTQRDEYATQQWYHEEDDTYLAYDFYSNGYNSDLYGTFNTRIGLLDYGGVYTPHCDFWELVHPGTSKIIGVTFSDPLDPNDPLIRYYAHGTWMAGLIGATGSNIIADNPAGVAGMHQTCKIFSYDMNSAPDDLERTQLFLEAIDDECKIVNLSWMTHYLPNQPRYSFYDYVMTAYLYNHGILPVAARGNLADEDGTRDPQNTFWDTRVAYPACCGDYIMSVGAVNFNGSGMEHSSFSNYKGTLDLVTWGGEDWGNINHGLLTTAPYTTGYPSLRQPGSYFDHITGTSASAALASGAAALIHDAAYEQNNITLYGDDLQGIMRATVNDYTGNPDSPFGLGRLSVNNAVRAVSPPNNIFLDIQAVGTPEIDIIEGDIFMSYIFMSPQHGNVVGPTGLDLYEVTLDINYSDYFGETLPSSQTPIVWANSFNHNTGYNKYKHVTGMRHVTQVVHCPYAEVVPGSETNEGCTLRTYVYNSGAYGYIPLDPLNGLEFYFSISADMRPDNPSNLDIVGNPMGHVQLQWTSAVDTDGDLAGYHIYRTVYDEFGNPGEDIQIGTVGENVTTFEDPTYYWTDNGPKDANVYYADYWVKSFDDAGYESLSSNVVSDHVSTDPDKKGPAGGKKAEDPFLPLEHRIVGSFPNPFNSSTTLKFGLSSIEDVELKVYNINGQLVLEREIGRMNAGWHNITLEMADFSTGIYFCNMKIGDFEGIQKITMIK